MNTKTIRNECNFKVRRIDDYGIDKHLLKYLKNFHKIMKVFDTVMKEEIIRDQREMELDDIDALKCEEWPEYKVEYILRRLEMEFSPDFSIYLLALSMMIRTSKRLSKIGMIQSHHFLNCLFLVCFYVSLNYAIDRPPKLKKFCSIFNFEKKLFFKMMMTLLLKFFKFGFAIKNEEQDRILWMLKNLKKFSQEYKRWIMLRKEKEILKKNIQIEVSC